MKGKTLVPQQQQKIQAQIASIIGSQVIEITTLSSQLDEANERVMMLTVEKDRLASELEKAQAASRRKGVRSD